MKLYHVTPARNEALIESDGRLRADMSQGAEECVWLCSQSLIDWAVEHVRERHNCRSLRIYYAEIPRRELKRFRRGRWRCYRDVIVETNQSWTVQTQTEESEIPW